MRAVLIGLTILLTIVVPAVAVADSHGAKDAGAGQSEAPAGQAMEGMDDEDMEEGAIPAGRGMDMGYEPVKQAANDSSMALVTVGVFMIPVMGWFIVRSVKRAQKSK